MNARAREPRGRLLVTLVFALFLSVVPLPAYLDAVRPSFLVLTVLYWSIAARRGHRHRLVFRARARSLPGFAVG
jgi:cell shape-determining protein MreD